MNKPLRSRFMGHDYKILWEPSSSITLMGPNGEEVRCYGLTEEGDQTIRMEDSLAPTLERAILLHETLHQLINSSGLELDGEVEEKVVTFLGEALGSNIQSNPAYWRYVTRPIKENP
jgi:hypothetical protein